VNIVNECKSSEPFLVPENFSVLIVPFSLRQIRPPTPSLPRLTGHISRWYTLMTLPDENRLVRRDLRGFRPELSATNLSPSYFASEIAVANAAPARSKISSNPLSPATATTRPNDVSPDDGSAATSRRQQLNYLNQPSTFRRSLGPGVRSSKTPRPIRPIRPIPSANLSETLQVRMATNAMAAAARARNLSPRIGRP
jgi:hypothetical protein